MECSDFQYSASVCCAMHLSCECINSDLCSAMLFSEVHRCAVQGISALSASSLTPPSANLLIRGGKRSKNLRWRERDPKKMESEIQKERDPKKMEESSKIYAMDPDTV